MFLGVGKGLKPCLFRGGQDGLVNAGQFMIRLSGGWSAANRIAGIDKKRGGSRSRPLIDISVMSLLVSDVRVSEKLHKDAWRQPARTNGRIGAQQCGLASSHDVGNGWTDVPGSALLATPSLAVDGQGARQCGQRGKLVIPSRE